MSGRKSKVDNGYLAASTNAHIGEALGADRQDFPEAQPSRKSVRRSLPEFFRTLGEWLLARLPRLRRPRQK